MPLTPSDSNLIYLGDMSNEEFKRMQERSGYGPHLMIADAKQSGGQGLGVYIHKDDKARVDNARREKYSHEGGALER